MTTEPAGEGISDDEMVEEVTSQTSPDLKVEEVFERESDGAVSSTEIADTAAEDMSSG